MINWETEWPLIKEEAIRCGVDPFFIATIRKVENGGLGREFGILSETATLYKDQLHDACASVRNRIIEFIAALFILNTYDGVRRLCYTKGFITMFSNRWAPKAAENDPDNLNANWLANALITYQEFCAKGGPS